MAEQALQPRRVTVSGLGFGTGAQVERETVRFECPGVAVGFVPLIDVTPRNGEAAVVFAALCGAGFDVVTECDLRGWVHYYRPFMSLLRPVTIWVPESQLDDARDYLKAPVDCAPDDGEPSGGFWAAVHDNRRSVCTAYLAVFLFMGG